MLPAQVAVFLEPTRVAPLLAVRGDGDVFEPQIYAYELEILLDFRKDLYVFGADETDVILSGWVFRDGAT